MESTSTKHLLRFHAKNCPCYSIANGNTQYGHNSNQHQHVVSECNSWQTRLYDPTRRIYWTRKRRSCLSSYIKAFYGTKQAPYFWSKRHEEAIRKFGLKPILADTCIFVRITGEKKREERIKRSPYSSNSWKTRPMEVHSTIRWRNLLSILVPNSNSAFYLWKDLSGSTRHRIPSNIHLPDSPDLENLCWAWYEQLQPKGQPSRRYHFIRDNHESKKNDVQYVESSNQLADIFTPSQTCLYWAKA